MVINTAVKYLYKYILNIFICQKTIFPICEVSCNNPV